MTSASQHPPGAGVPGIIAVFVKGATLVVGGFFFAVGVWSFVWPRTFFEALAMFPPYNRHFLHDSGAFLIGLGVTVLLTLRWSDAMLVALTGISVASWLHVLSHLLDRHIGGNPATDIPGLAVLALLSTAAAVARAVLPARDAHVSGIHQPEDEP